MNQSICTMEVFVKETYRSMQILENSVLARVVELILFKSRYMMRVLET
jgi:hypothetical protein